MAVIKVKDYKTSGVSANVQLGSGGSFIDASNTAKVTVNAFAGGLGEVAIANGTAASHAVTLEQLRASSKNKLRNDQFLVAYNAGNVNLANAQPNTWITSVVVEAANIWVGADSNTNITVGDSGDTSRLFAAFDVDAQTVDETDHLYTTETTISAYVTQGAASAGKAIITIWYVGELKDP